MSTAILMCALFFAKVIDNALSTTKTILVQRNHCILAGIALKGCPHSFSPQSSPNFPILFRKFFQSHISRYSGGTCISGGFVVPPLKVQRFQSLLKLFRLLANSFLLTDDQLQPLRNGRIPLHGHMDELPNVFQRHTGFFKAFDNLQPFIIRILKHTDTVAGALHERQQAFLIIVSECGCLAGAGL